MEKFIFKVDFGIDLERYLNFYSEIRAIFGIFNDINKTLVIYLKYIFQIIIKIYMFNFLYKD